MSETHDKLDDLVSRRQIYVAARFGNVPGWYFTWGARDQTDPSYRH